MKIFISLSYDTRIVNLELTSQHVSIGTVRYCKYMRRHFVSLYALIPFHYLFGIDGQFLVWIDHNAEKTGICLK